MRGSWFLATAAAFLSAASPALALVKVTYTGTVASGSDLTGLFGAANADLAGLSFRAVYLFDDNPDGQFFNPPFSSGWTSLFDPGPKVFLTIGGVTVVSDCGFFTPDYCGFTHTQTAAPGDWRLDSELNAFVVDATPPAGPRTWTHQIDIGVMSAVHPFLDSFDYRTSAHYVLQPGDTGFGTVSLENIVDGGAPTEHFGYRVNAVLTPLVVTIGVPEPATWAVMILGFGMAGAALRRRRREPAHASHTIIRVANSWPPRARQGVGTTSPV
jgi:hypothetical protein